MLNLGDINRIRIPDEDEIYVDNLISSMDNAFEYYDAIMGFDDEEESVEGLKDEVVKRAKLVRDTMKAKINTAKAKINNVKNSLKDALVNMLSPSISFLEAASSKLASGHAAKMADKAISDREWLDKSGRDPKIRYKRNVLLNWLMAFFNDESDDWRAIEQKFVQYLNKDDKVGKVPISGSAHHDSFARSIDTLNAEIDYLKKLHNFLLRLQNSSSATTIHAVRRFMSSTYNSKLLNQKRWHAILEADNEIQMKNAIRSLLKNYRDKLHCIHSWVKHMQIVYQQIQETYSPYKGKQIVKTFLMPEGVVKELENVVKTNTPGVGSWRPKTRRILVTSYAPSVNSNHAQFAKFLSPLKMSKGKLVDKDANGATLGSIVLFADTVLTRGIVSIASVIVHEAFHAIDHARKTNKKGKWQYQNKWDGQAKKYADRREEQRAFQTQGKFVQMILDGEIPRTGSIITWAKDIKRKVEAEAKRLGYKPRKTPTRNLHERLNTLVAASRDQQS